MNLFEDRELSLMASREFTKILSKSIYTNLSTSSFSNLFRLLFIVHYFLLSSLSTNIRGQYYNLYLYTANIVYITWAQPGSYTSSSFLSSARVDCFRSTMETALVLVPIELDIRFDRKIWCLGWLYMIILDWRSMVALSRAWSLTVSARCS